MAVGTIPIQSALRVMRPAGRITWERGLLDECFGVLQRTFSPFRSRQRLKYD
jgi:hypothetical protein